MKLGLLLLPILMLCGSVDAFWFKKPTKKQIIYMKTKAFFGHKATLCGLSAGAGVAAVLLFQKYQQSQLLAHIGHNFQANR